MTGNPRRPGFRLPWTAEPESTEQSPGADPVEAAPSDAPSSSGQPSAESAVATSSLPESGERPERAASASATGSTDVQPAAAVQPDAADSGLPGRASEEGADATPAPDAFLRELVDAMRSVADNARDANLAELREQAAERARQMAAESEQRIAALRATADADVTGIGEWAAAEAERIRVEAERRVSERRAQLEHELAAESQRASDELNSMQGRVADYERELASFHSQLSEISDPAAFAAAAKRIPAPPALGAASGTSATGGTEPPVGVAAPAAAVADNGATRAPAEGTVVPGHPTDGGPVTSAPTGAPGTAETAAAREDAPHVAEVPTTPVATAAPSPEEEPQPTSDTVAVTASAVESTDDLAASEGTPTATKAPAPAPAPTSGPAQTAVVVRGLSSFGAITGFRQSLAAAEGVEGVNLSLGQTGEFLYRATHADGFDLAAAIRQLEGEGAEIEKDASGTLHVTISRSR